MNTFVIESSLASLHLICILFLKIIETELVFFPQDSGLFFLYCALFILKRFPLVLFLSPDERESRYEMGEVEKKPYNPAK